MKRIISISLIFLFTGCGSVHYYWPTMQNVPLFKEKNEIKTSFGYSDYGELNDFGYLGGRCVDAAYSITDHIACQFVSGSKNNKVNSRDAYAEVIELSAGYYLRYREHLAFETFGGYSYGMVLGDDEFNKTKANFNRIFIQPSIGFASDYLDIAFTPRFAKVDYTIKENTVYHLSPQNDIIINMDKHSYYFFEPGITIRFGFKYVKFQYQYVAVQKLNKEELMFASSVNSISIQFTMPVKKKHTLSRRHR
ncbi:MAG: hypothetical protein ACOYO1_06120 [Bacteroidales bacterium]